VTMPDSGPAFILPQNRSETPLMEYRKLIYSEVLLHVSLAFIAVWITMLL